MTKYDKKYICKTMEETKLSDIVMIKNTPCLIVDESFRGYNKFHKIKQIICKGIFDDLKYDEIASSYEKILYPILQYNSYIFTNIRNNIIEAVDDIKNEMIEFEIVIHDECIEKLLNKINAADIIIKTIEFDGQIRIINVE